MKKIAFHKQILALALASIALFSCTTEVDWETEIDKLKLDQAILLPIGETELTINDILQQIDSLDFLDLSSTSNVYFSLADSADLDFEPISGLGAVSPESRTAPLFGQPVVNGYINGTVNVNLPLGINSNTTNQRIDKAIINTALLGVKITVEGILLNPSDILISMVFPVDRLKFDDTSITKVDFVPTQFGSEGDKTLAPFTYFSPNAATSVPVTFNVRVYVGSKIITPLSMVKFETRFKSMTHRAVYGYFTPSEAAVNSALNNIKSLDISEIVNEIEQYGVFKFAEPEVQFDITNYMGIKFNLNFNKVLAYRKNDATFDSIKAKFNGLDSKIEPINRMVALGDQPAKTTFKLNQEADKGQLNLFFEKTKLPTDFKFDLKVSNARTASESLLIPDFITDKQRIKLKKTLRVPLKFNTGSYIEVKDTIDNIELDSLLENDEIQQAQLAFKITNKLPLNCKVSAKFFDVNGAVLPLELLSSSELKAPQVDNTGAVIKTQTFESTVMYVKVVKSQLDDLKKVKKIIVTFYMNNIENKPMNFQKQDAIKIKLGVFVQGNYSVNQNN